MNNQLTKTFHVPSSGCDAQGLLGIRNIFDLFMDLAAEHAVELGVGYLDMLERGCYWVAVRSRVRIYRRAKLGQTVTAETWPGKPGLAKSDRFYRLMSGGGLLAEGRTEWAAQDIETGAVRRTDSYAWPDLEPRPERVCGEPFTRFRPLASGETFSYTVSSMDIDTGRHMNNVAYIRMLLATFTTAELAAMDIGEMEISYRRACREGERLSIRRLASDGLWLFQADSAGGETAAQARIVTLDNSNGR